MVYLAAGDLGIEVDYGTNAPGDVLQRFEDGVWNDYRPAVERITSPFNLRDLEPGRYRLRAPGRRS